MSSWQKRAQRAEELAGQHAYAAELLGFYVRLVRFQGSMQLGLQNSPPDFSEQFRASQLLTNSEPFLKMVEQYGPARLADVALRIRSNEIAKGWTERLAAVWSEPKRVPAEPEDFLARMFLQPYAERVRSSLPAPRDRSAERLCPLCGRKPVAGVLRPQGDGALRSLLCSFCFGEWEFRRILCANCGEEDNQKLPVYQAVEFPHMRVECCDSCRTYSKTTDLTKNGHADPLVDEIASVPLDLWAQTRGYIKLHPNSLAL